MDEKVIPDLSSIPSLGDKPNEGDVSYFQTLSSVFDRARLPHNPMWNDEYELSIMRSYSYIQPITPIMGSLNDRIAKRFPLSDLNKPRDSVAVLQTAIRYAYENPFVAKAMRIKTDFTCQDFEHKTLNETVKDFYDEEVDRLNLKTIFRHIVWHAYAIGIVPIWWGGEESRQIKFIELLDPRMCHIEYNFGKAKLYLKIDEKMRQAAYDPEGKIDIRNKARAEAMPKYWIKQILDQVGKVGVVNGFIELQDGSYTVIENRYTSLNRVMGELDGLPLQPAFDALQQYRLLQAGDFAVAWNLKNMITLIKEGDPKAEGPNWVPVTGARLAKLQSQFQRPDSAFTVYCDSTTKVEFVIPPKEAWSLDKYLQREKEIKEVLNIPSFLWSGSDSGSNFANAVSEIKALRMEVQSVREILQETFWKPLYRRLRSQVSRPGFKQTDLVYPSFNNTSLQDDATFFKNASDLYSRGAISVKSLQELNGFDHDYEMSQKKKEFDDYGPTNTQDVVNDTIARPLYEPSQGNMNPIRDDGGNPGTSSGATKQTPQHARDKSRSPRTGGS